MPVLRKKTENAKKRRVGHVAIMLFWLKRSGMVLGALAFLAWSGAWFFLSEADTQLADWSRQKALNTTAGMGFTVQNMLIEGRTYSDIEVLKALINVQEGDPLFSFSPSEAQTLIEKISWVRHAHVERRLPDTIYIKLEERKPLALWQKDKKLSLLDGEGQKIATGRMNRFKDLIIVIGQEAPARAPELIMNLAAEPHLYEHTKAATWVGGRRWDLTMQNNITVKLPEEDMGFALRRLASVQEKENILDKDIKAVDLRDQSRIVVRTRPGAVREYKAGLKLESNI